MANHKSAEKRARQSVKRSVRNAKARSSVKTYEKTLLKAIDTKSKDIAELLKSYVSKMAKAAQKGIVSKSTASRKIGRLSARATSVSNVSS